MNVRYQPHVVLLVVFAIVSLFITPFSTPVTARESIETSVFLPAIVTGEDGSDAEFVVFETPEEALQDVEEF